MKLATIKQIQELRRQAASDKPQAASCKQRAFFDDFYYPDVWYKIWLQGIEEYLEKRHKRQASSLKLGPTAKLSE